MEIVNLPGSDLNVSQICLGTWQFNGGVGDINWDPMSEEVSKTIVDRALESGINFIDTAQGYNNSEKILGRILQGRRNDVVLATKFGIATAFESVKYSATDIEKQVMEALQRLQTDRIDLMQAYRNSEAILGRALQGRRRDVIIATKVSGDNKGAAELEQAVEASLRELQTDYIDLFQIHWPTVLRDYKEAVVELKRLQAIGRIRYYGVCNFGHENLREFLDAGGKPLTNQVAYNLLWRSMEHKVTPICVENDITILPYSPLQQGLLAGKFASVEDVPIGRRRIRLFNAKSCERQRHNQPGFEKEMFEAINTVRSACEAENVNMAGASLSWLLNQPATRSLIVGVSGPDQVERNTRLPKLSAGLLEKMSSATNDLKMKLGPCYDQYADNQRAK